MPCLFAERALSPSANSHCTKCVPTVLPEVCSLCVSAICEVFAAKIVCYTARSFIYDSFIIGLCLSFFLSYNHRLVRLQKCSNT